MHPPPPSSKLSPYLTPKKHSPPTRSLSLSVPHPSKKIIQQDDEKYPTTSTSTI